MHNKRGLALALTVLILTGCNATTATQVCNEDFNNQASTAKDYITKIPLPYGSYNVPMSTGKPNYSQGRLMGNIANQFSITAATTTGPASGPLPASSIPQIFSIPTLYNSFSISFNLFNLSNI